MVARGAKADAGAAGVLCASVGLASKVSSITRKGDRVTFL